MNLYKKTLLLSLALLLSVLEQLRAGGIKAVEQISDYSPAWGGWRGQHDEILAALFPLEGSED